MKTYSSKSQFKKSPLLSMKNSKFLKQNTNQLKAKAILVKAASTSLIAALLVFTPYSLSLKPDSSSLTNSYFLTINPNNANANMLNKFKDGFYFEKYSTAEEAKEALLELHPIGSDVGELVKTLEGAGGKCGTIDKIKYNTKPENLNYSELTKIINCKYQHFYAMNWEIGIMCVNNLIDDIGIRPEYTGL